MTEREAAKGRAHRGCLLSSSFFFLGLLLLCFVVCASLLRAFEPHSVAFCAHPTPTTVGSIRFPKKRKHFSLAKEIVADTLPCVPKHKKAWRRDTTEHPPTGPPSPEKKHSTKTNMATFARRPANPFANVIQRAQPAPTSQARESPPQPASAPRETALETKPENDMRAAAAQRWRNYGGASVTATTTTATATDAAASTPLATAPAAVAPSPSTTTAPVASVAPVVAVRPRLSRPPFGASRRLGSRATPPSTAAVPSLPLAAEPVTTHDQAIPLQQPQPHGRSNEQTHAPSRPTDDTPPTTTLVPTTDATTTSPTSLPAIAVPTMPSPVPCATPSPTVPLPVSPSEHIDALSAALADAAHQRDLVARLVATIAAGCPSCCAKVVSVLTDAKLPPVPAVPSMTAASSGPAPQHIHLHLATDTRASCKAPSRAACLRRKSVGVALKHRCK